MKYCLLFFLLGLVFPVTAQTTMRISGDTVKIENGELQLRNSSSNIAGFLFNEYNGRTAFRQLGNSIQFVAGAPSFPKAGDSTYVNMDFTGQAIKVWRNGLLQYRDISNGVAIDTLAGKITFRPALATGDRIYIEAINAIQVSANDNNTELPPVVSAGLGKLYAGVTDNGNSFTLRWTTNAKTLFLSPKIVGIGSSTLAGYGLQAPYRLGDKINTWLGSNVSNANWKNLAIGGTNSRDMLPEKDGGMFGANIDSAMNSDPDFIFLSLASNDPSAGISVNQSITNYKKLDSIALSRGVPLFIETTQPRSQYDATQQGMLKALADSVRKIWPDRYVEGFLDVVDKNAATPAAILPQYNNGDGIHLNPNGNQFIADRLFDRWTSYFRFPGTVKRFVVDTSGNNISWQPFDTIQDKNTVKKVYAKLQNKDLYFRVKAELASGDFTPYSSVALLKAYVAPPVPTVFDHRILIDIGGDGFTTLNGSSQKDGKLTPSPDAQGKTWNNWYGIGDVRGFISGAEILGLKTVAAAQTVIGMRLIGNPQGTFTSSVATQAINYNGFKVGVNDYPMEAVYDNMFIHNTAGGGDGVTLRLKNLSKTNTYYIKIWGARLDDNNTPRNLVAKLGTDSWTGAPVVNTRYPTTAVINYNNAIVLNSITGVDSLDINLKAGVGSTFGHVSIIDIGIMGTLPPAPKIIMADTSTILNAIQMAPQIVTAGSTISSYQWTQIGGPATVNIANATQPNATISNLSNGTFSLRLSATTTAGITITGDIQVKVFPNNGGKKTLRVNFSNTKIEDIPGWLNAYGPITANKVSYTDVATNWTIDNASTSNTFWGSYTGVNASDVNGKVTGNNTGVIPDIALKSYWFNYSVPYAAGKNNVIISGLNPSKTYTLKLYASRTSADNTTAPRYGVWRINGGAEVIQDALDNTTNESVVTNITPDANGNINIAVYQSANSPTYGSFSFLNALILQEN
ncbi:SGNH/GDSL hydrolase family protein [Chitinophaga arvensicola]|uniref:Lysophospholipase L1 n=1 Tax=Chitinophaga arvensicola TaxID=29529 RepID=A0A1I0S9N5_9BACT|nr:SGNH/GDSL hydrolase family protein [Chitinophaga arvensicola]SEW52807.1 Lysophospholipase L1 [Chitinophaga arvensicola]